MKPKNKEVAKDKKINDNKKKEIKIIGIYKNSAKIKIFGNTFVENNKYNCKLIIEDKEKKLSEYYKPKGNNEKSISLKIILKVNGIITNISQMFHQCIDLIQITELSFNESKGKNLLNISGLFSHCESLISLPPKLNLDISNVKNISNLFLNCSSLTDLPDISKWDTKNVQKMGSVFKNCKKIQFLPDISKWNTSKVTDMSSIFEGMQSLLYLPDISKWNVENVTDMNSMFSSCYSLNLIPDISKWKTYKITNMSYIFYKCFSLTSLPDISKWNMGNIQDIKHIFGFMYAIHFLPDISKWNINNNININLYHSNINLVNPYYFEEYSTRVAILDLENKKRKELNRPGDIVKIYDEDIQNKYVKIVWPQNPTNEVLTELIQEQMEMGAIYYE